MASVCSLGLAMTLGFERVVWCGAGLYAIAALLLLIGPRGAATTERAPANVMP
jgi:hypothetical protein